jgi:hypothetical protein
MRIRFAVLAIVFVYLGHFVYLITVLYFFRLYCSEQCNEIGLMANNCRKVGFFSVPFSILQDEANYF